jgi:hypothetical protein
MKADASPLQLMEDRAMALSDPDTLKILELQLENQKIMSATLTSLSRLVKEQAMQMTKMSNDLAQLSSVVQALVAEKAVVEPVIPPRARH